MNPLIRSKSVLWKFLLLSLFITLTYTFSFGFAFQLPISCILMDAWIYATVFIPISLLLWHIIRYTIPNNKYSLFQIISLMGLGLLVLGFVHGLESLVWYFICSNCSFEAYLQSLSIRILFSVMVYVILLMYYKPYLKTETEEDLPREIKIPEETPPQAPIERISIRNGQKIKIIPLQDILYLQAEGDYVAIITGEGKCLKEQTMKYFEENLPKDRFIRIHRSYIVAVNAITRIYGLLYLAK